MSKSNQVTMVLTLIDGSQRKFVYEMSDDDRLRLSGRAEVLLSQPWVGIELPDKVLYIPIGQIKSMEFSPAPEVHLAKVIGPATEITGE